MLFELHMSDCFALQSSKLLFNINQLQEMSVSSTSIEINLYLKIISTVTVRDDSTTKNTSLQ